MTHQRLPVTRHIAGLLLEANANSSLVVNGQPDILETATFAASCQIGNLHLLKAFVSKRRISSRMLSKGIKLATDMNNVECAEFLTVQRDLEAQELDQMPALEEIGAFLPHDTDDLPPLMAIASCQQGGAAAGSGR
jgi:hypothetical protein